LIGAVAYNPRVVPIWEGMRDYFREVGPAIDYVLFSNYDRQVQALLSRQIDIAWNTNLAWVRRCIAAPTARVGLWLCATSTPASRQ
jgi:ABC-type phosphate/phosphonate transport system substrate-binding protein